MSRYKPLPRAAKRNPGPREWRCVHHGCENFPDCPQLKDLVWADIAGPKCLLCIEHTEFRLGRPITVDDLEDCIANSFTFLLIDRAVEAAGVEYERCRTAVAECETWSPAQGEWSRARDHCLNIKERIEKL